MNPPSESPYIYADNAATTPLLPEALDAMMPYFREKFANSSSLYSLGQQTKKILNESREIIAGCINANPDEIIFTSGGTESNNWAIKNGILSGDVLTTQIEHHAILNACSFTSILPNEQRKTHFLPVTSSGLLEPKTLEQALSNRVSLVSVMLANNEIGTIEPIREFARIAHRGNAVFHTDAVQAVGHIPVDVNDLETDMLSASAHKFGGPKGIGFLFIRKGVSISPLINGGQQEFGKRAGTENIAAIVGMAAALKNSCENMNIIRNKLNKITNCFINTLKIKIPNIVFNGESENRLPGHVSMSVPCISGEGLLHYLDMKHIAVSTGAACNSESTVISHVLQAIHLSPILARGTIRVTFGRQNTIDECKAITGHIEKYVSLINSSGF